MIKYEDFITKPQAESKTDDDVRTAIAQKLKNTTFVTGVKSTFSNTLPDPDAVAKAREVKSIAIEEVLGQPSFPMIDELKQPKTVTSDIPTLSQDIHMIEVKEIEFEDLPQLLQSKFNEKAIK